MCFTLGHFFKFDIIVTTLVFEETLFKCFVRISLSHT